MAPKKTRNGQKKQKQTSEGPQPKRRRTSDAVRSDDATVSATTSSPETGISAAQLQTLTSSILAAVEQKITAIIGGSMPAASATTPSATVPPTDLTPSGHSSLDLNINETPESLSTPFLQTLEQSSATTSGTTNNQQIYQSISSLQTSKSIPLHAQVPLKLKEKIWNNEYIDFSTAFSNSASGSIQLTISEKGIATVQTQNQRKFLNIEQWTDAFNMFSSVYRLKYADTAEQLAQYCATVRSIAQSQGNWFLYDVQFRTIRQCHPMPWDEIHNELYMKALTQRQPFRAPLQKSPASFQGQTRTCNKYNRGEHCSGCSYKHKCRTCTGNHPQFKCWKRGDKASNSNTGKPFTSQSLPASTPRNSQPQLQPRLQSKQPSTTASTSYAR